MSKYRIYEQKGLLLNLTNSCWYWKASTAPVPTNILLNHPRKYFKMKNHFLPFFLMLACLAVASCKKDNKLDPDGDRFSAKIDGELFEANKVTGTQISGVITIGAASSASGVPTFGVSIATSILSTYKFGTQSKVSAFYSPVASNPTNQYVAKSGSLTIEEHDVGYNTIKCTFNFTGINASGETIEVTDGSFELKYEE
jgi:Family of unknown function (DUF6252)